MKPKAYFPSLHALNFHNRSWKLFTFSLLLLLTLLLTTLFTFQFYLDEMDQVKREVYGPFRSIIYQDPTAFSLDRGNTYPYELRQLSIKAEGRPLTVGYLTDQAYGLLFGGNVDPVSDNTDCILSTSCAVELEVDKGDRLSIPGHTLLVRQIITDYGKLWVRGMEEEAAAFTPAQLLVSKTLFDTLAKGHTSSVRRIIFLNENTAISDIEYGNMYRNYRIERSADQELYNSPAYFEYIAYGLVVLILSFLSVFYRRASAPRLHILHRLGLSAADSGFLIGSEVFVSVCLVLVLAEFLSYGITTLTLSLLFSRPVVPELGKWGALTRKILAITLTFALLLWIFYHPGNKLAATEKVQKRHTIHRSSLIVLPFDTQETISLILAIVMFTFIPVFVYSYYYATNILVSSVDGQGRFVSTYDFELKADNSFEQNMPMHAIINGKDYDNSQDSSFFFFNPTPQNGNMVPLLKQLRQDQAVADAYPYYESNMVYVEIPAEHAADSYFSTKFIPEVVLTQHPIFEGQVDFSARALVQSRLLGLPDPELKAILASLDKAKYPDIDVESILAGKAAILVTPSYDVQEQVTLSEDGTKHTTKYMSFVDSHSASAITQQALKSHSETVLWNLAARHQHTQGSLTMEQARAELMLQSHVLPIAVNVQENIAWFDSQENAFPYRLLVSNRYIEEQHIAEDYARIRIYLKGQVKEDADTLQRLRQILASGGSVQVSDQHLQMSTLHAYQQNQITFKLLWYVLSIILFVFVGSGIFNNHLSKHHSRYLILFRLGLPRSKVCGQMSLQALMITIVSGLASILLYMIVFRKLTHIWMGMSLVRELYCIFLPLLISFSLLCLVIHLKLKQYFRLAVIH